VLEMHLVPNCMCRCSVLTFSESPSDDHNFQVVNQEVSKENDDLGEKWSIQGVG
jgi:hypothetical protein